MESSNQQEYIYKLLSEIVRTEIRNLGLLNGDWHLGKVDSVVSNKMLNVLIDGSSTPQPVPCNPDINFSPQDNVIVVYINGNSKDKFVLCKRAV